MSTSRYELFNTMYSEKQGGIVPGFIREDIISFLKTTVYKKLVIPLQYDCRPDLISYAYFGDPNLYWILVYANSINDSPEGFAAGKSIIIPDISKLRDKI